jgi:hypothetical protein
MAPLAVSWRYLRTRCRGLAVFASGLEAVERSADALIALTRPLFENPMPLAAEAGASARSTASASSMSTGIGGLRR